VSEREYSKVKIEVAYKRFNAVDIVKKKKILAVLKYGRNRPSLPRADRLRARMIRAICAPQLGRFMERRGSFRLVWWKRKGIGTAAAPVRLGPVSVVTESWSRCVCVRV